MDTLKSGMVISPVLQSGSSSEYEWTIGWAAGRIAYWALQDGNQYDVKSANSLVGYSCLGDFELQTGYFKSDDAYPVGTPLTPDGTTGNVKATTAGGGTAIVGYSTQNITDLSAGGPTGYPSLSGVTNPDVIAFQTAWLPANAND